MNSIQSYGRVCFFGEHSDWASEFNIHDGRALAAPIDLGIFAKAKKSDVFSIYEDNRRIRFENNELCAIIKDNTNFYRYVCSAVYLMKKYYNTVENVNIVIEQKDLPVRAGLSSSAAISNLIVKAFDTVYNLHLSENEMMNISYESERLTGSNCGKLDQIGILKKCLYDIQFHEYVSFNQCEINGEWYFFIVVLGTEKDTSRILCNLKNSYMKNLELQNFLGSFQREIVEEAILAFKNYDLEKMGKLMNLTQKYFDNIIMPLSFKELKAPKFHNLIRNSYVLERVLGEKEIGSHGDGTALFLTENEKRCNECIQYIKRTYGYQTIMLKIH